MIIWDELFLAALASGTAILFYWAFRVLPKEEWQILACIPRFKNKEGLWSGVNLTFYGFFSASSQAYAVFMFFLLSSSAGVSWHHSLIVLIPVLAIGAWASKFIARLVEKKPATLSVGAASFACILVAPWLIWLADFGMGRWIMVQMPLIEILASMMIAYAFGEGAGRLACISFGCCYGKPLDQCHPYVQKAFERHHFAFQGKTKKIIYADKMEGRAVVPVQAMTAVVSTGCGLLGLYLFLKGLFAAALFLTLVVTQSWRFASEFLRADYRGQGKLSFYQIMSVLAQIYLLLIVLWGWKPPRGASNLPAGLSSLWQPEFMILMASLWLVVFIYSGKSEVTHSSIVIHLDERKI